MAQWYNVDTIGTRTWVRFLAVALIFRIFLFFLSKSHYVKLSEVCTYSAPSTDALTVLPLIRFLDTAAAALWQIIGTSTAVLVSLVCSEII